MQAAPLIAEMERATQVAWIVTAILGIAAGFMLRLVFRATAQVTHMRVVSALVTTIVGMSVFAGLQVLRYRIQEAPFEPPVWIDPGWISLYLPAVAIIVGLMLAASFGRQVAAR